MFYTVLCCTSQKEQNHVCIHDFSCHFNRKIHKYMLLISTQPFQKNVNPWGKI